MRSRTTAPRSGRRSLAGELAILYASVWQSIFGVAEVAGEPEHDPAKTRWAWRFPIRPLVVVEDLERAPAVEEAGIFSANAIWLPHHRYIRLTERVNSSRPTSALVERRLAHRLAA